MVRTLTRSLAGLLTTSALFAATLTPAFADQRDFTLVNDAPLTIANLYVSPAEMNEWGGDILGDQVIPSGESASVTFDGNAAGDCNYDIMVRGQGGEEGVLFKVDLCSISVVRFS
jgi:hypothetical protein